MRNMWFKKVKEKIRPVETYVEQESINRIKSFARKLEANKFFLWCTGLNMILGGLFCFFTETLYLVFLGFGLPIIGVSLMAKETSDRLTVLLGLFLVIALEITSIIFLYRILFGGYVL